MKKTFKEVIKMAAFYASVGFVIQILFWNLIIAATPVAAQNLHDIKISVNINNVKLEKALQIIESKTNFVFSYLRDEIPVDENVTINCSNEALYDVLYEIGKNIGLNFSRINEYITIKKNDISTESIISVVETCTIKGKVTDLKTGETLAGASVSLRGTTKGAYTDTKGYYEIDNIKPGKYTIAVSYIGYSTTTKAIVVTADRTMEINLQLGQSVVNLDEVVVTGSISDRSIRESANPITVISPLELENRNLTSFGSILETVPGIIPPASGDQASYSGRTYDNSATNLNIRGYSPSGTLTASTKYILDGVELTDYRALNYLDPNSIEKIEVSRGPMSSTLYGTGSSGGIIQIFTKKGSGNLKLNFRTMLTSKESKYDDANPLNSDYSLSLRGGKADFGYNVALNYALFPVSRWAINNGIDEQDWVLSSGVYGVISNVKVDLNVQYSSNELGRGLYQTWYKVALENGWANPERLKSTSLTDYRYRNIGKTMTLNIRQPLSDNLYHNLTAGISNTESNIDYYTPYLSSGTNYYTKYNNYYKRTSLKYFLNLIQPIVADLKVDLTGGFEYSKGVADALSIGFNVPYDENVYQQVVPSYGGSMQTSSSATTGIFAEGVWGFQNNLFLTTGFRLEKNTSYGDDLGWYTMPRIGLTYIVSLGDFTFKPRFSWGKSTQALSPAYKQSSRSVNGSYTTIYLANGDLKPQEQSGYEIGTDFFLSDYLSLGVTYYDQKVDNLIQSATIPSTDPNTSIYQYQNVSKVYNKGIELNGKIIYDRFMLNLSYTHVSSKYGSGFPNSKKSPYIVDGGRTAYVPSGSFSARLSYDVPSFLPWTNKGGRLSVDYIWRGGELSSDYYSYYRTYAETGKYASLIYKEFDGYSKINLRGDYFILNDISVFFDVANLLNNQDIIAGTYPMSGRKISFGFNYSL